MANGQTILARQRECIQALERQLEKERAVLAGMQMMAAASPSPTYPQPPREASSSTGRQEGAISKRWRKVLGTLGRLYDDGFSTVQVIECVRQFEDREMKPSQVRRIFAGYVDQKILEQLFADHYRVNDAAWERLGLNEYAETAQTVSEETEAPVASLPSASGNGWSVQPPQPFQVKPNPWPAARESE